MRCNQQVFRNKRSSHWKGWIRPLSHRWFFGSRYWLGNIRALTWSARSRPSQSHFILDCMLCCISAKQILDIQSSRSFVVWNFKIYWLIHSDIRGKRRSQPNCNYGCTTIFNGIEALHLSSRMVNRNRRKHYPQLPWSKVLGLSQSQKCRRSVNRHWFTLFIFDWLCSNPGWCISAADSIWSVTSAIVAE